MTYGTHNYRTSNHFAATVFLADAARFYREHFGFELVVDEMLVHTVETIAMTRGIVGVEQVTDTILTFVHETFDRQYAAAIIAESGLPLTGSEEIFA